MRFLLPSAAGACLALPFAGAFAADPLAVFNPARIGDERGAYLDASSFTGNDVLPVKTLLDGGKWREDYTPKEGKNVALAAARVESGFEWNSLRIGYVVRQEWVARAHKDTLDAYRVIQLNQQFTGGKDYKVDYAMEGFSAHGLQVGRAWSQPLGQGGWKLDFGLSLSLLKGQRIRRETWDGSIAAAAGDLASVDADISRNYDRMEKDVLRHSLPFSASPSGSGYALDLGFSLGSDDGMRLDWAMTDAAGKLYWKDVPSDTLAARDYVVCRHFSVDCLLAKVPPHVESLDTGVTRRNVRMRLQPKQALTLSLPIRQARVEVGDSYRDGEHFPRVGLRYTLLGSLGAALEYDFRLHSVALAVLHRWFYFGYQTDSLRPSKAKVLGFSLGARIPF